MKTRLSKHLARAFIAAACSVALSAPSALAQVYPNKPIKIIVPAPPGNTSDAAIRYLAQKMSTVLGQPVVIDNKAGASGSIGLSLGLKSPADGYTITMVSSTNTVAAVHTIKNLPYNPLTDMAPVAAFFVVPSVIVGSRNFAPNTFKEFWDYAKTHPGGVSFAYSNATGAVVGANVKRVANIDMVAVPYKAASQAVTELLGGQVPVMINDVAVTLPHIQAGAVKPYAVTSSKRSSVLPDVPTLSELLPEPITFAGWLGFVAPMGTPQPIISKLATVINDIVKTEETAKYLRNMGADPLIFTPEQFAEFIKVEEPKWGTALKAAGIFPE